MSRPRARNTKDPSLAAISCPTLVRLTAVNPSVRAVELTSVFTFNPFLGFHLAWSFGVAIVLHVLFQSLSRVPQTTSTHSSLASSAPFNPFLGFHERIE